MLYGPMNHILSQNLNTESSPIQSKPASDLIQSSSKPVLNPQEILKLNDLKRTESRLPIIEELRPISPNKLRQELKGQSPLKHLTSEEEIEKLKNELQEKEEELSRLRKGIEGKNSVNSEIINQISKLELDKRQIQERRKINSMSLDLQINEKIEKKRVAEISKEKELVRRLELLKVMKDQENQDLLQKAKRARQYKEELDILKYVRDSINPHEHSRSPENRSQLFQYQAPNPFAKGSNSSGSISPLMPKFTKKAQKTLAYDPITGKIVDSSPYIFGKHPLLSNVETKKDSTALADYGSMILNQKHS